MKIHGSLALLAFAAGFAGCATVDVQTDFSRNADFARYRTYDWFPQAQESGGTPLGQNPRMRNHIQAALERELSAKGLRLQPGGTTDFYVAYHLVGQEKVDGTSWGYGLGYWGHGSASGG